MSRTRKGTADETPALDVRTLHRRGVLLPGWRGGWQWLRRDAVIAVAGLEAVSLERLRVTYQATCSGQSETRTCRVAITWAPCHLGGARPWFQCPGCARRVAKLYLRGAFACRHCQGLNYATQQASQREGASERSWKLRQALGCRVGFLHICADWLHRPKGMHGKTFARKIAQLKRIEEAITAPPCNRYAQF